MLSDGHHNRYVKFNPTINAGHILTASTVLITAVAAWLQMRSDINTLVNANMERRQEIADIQRKQDEDKKDFFNKLEGTQVAFNGSIIQLRSEMGNRFDRLDDRFDKRMR